MAKQFSFIPKAVITLGYLPTYEATYDSVEVVSFACPFFPLHPILSLFVAKKCDYFCLFY
jgi:hypothetical protein